MISELLIPPSYNTPSSPHALAFVEPSEPSPSQLCVLESRAFQVLGEPLFLRGDADGVTMMRVQLGDTQAMVPLAMIQREAGISDDSPDGRMIALIGRSLAFLQFLSIGDPLPQEVLTGKASWTARPEFRDLALAKLEYGLVCNLASSGDEPANFDRQTLVACVNDPSFKPRVTTAFRRAAEILGLPDGDAVLAVMDGLAGELCFVESLRVQLLESLDSVAERLGRLRFRGSGNRQRREMLTQTQRMINRAITGVRARFVDIDAQTGEVIAVLRQAVAQTAYIRSRRDELYVTYRGWKDLRGQWDACRARSLDECWTLVDETYRFLVPRFLSYQEWKKAAERQAPAKLRQTVW